MARFRKIDSRLWNDSKFRALSDDAKLIFLFLLTHPYMTALGAMRGTAAGLAAEMGWSHERFAEGFREVCAKAMAEGDSNACLIALPNFIRYNRPESPNVVKAWAASFDLLPECELKTVVIKRAKAFTEDMSEEFTKAFPKGLPEAFAKTMPNQEQEKEPEKEKNKSTSSPSADAPVSVIPLILSDGSEFTPSAKEITEWSKQFSTVNIESELLKAQAWLKANPKRRKTRAGIARFCVSWFTRASVEGSDKSAPELSSLDHTAGLLEQNGEYRL